MRTVTKTYQILKFEELGEDAKTKAKDDFLSDPLRCDDFDDQLNMDLKHLFPYSNVKVQFSLGYCQGDGVNVYGELDVRDILSLIENDLAGNQFADMKAVLTDKEKKAIMFYFEHVGWTVDLPANRRYAYCMVDHLDFIWDTVNSLKKDGIANINKKALDKLHSLIVRIFHRLCKDYEDNGYKYFYEISDKDMQEVCDANEWEFYTDGSMYY